MMKNEFIPYEEALALKELGFDEDCFGFYIKEANNQACGGDYPCNGTNSAPLYQQAFRWFREKYGFVNETYIPLFITKRISVNGDTYEEAELACLRKLIEIVNQNKDALD
jgi:hypothetical protein